MGKCPGHPPENRDVNASSDPRTRKCGSILFFREEPISVRQPRSSWRHSELALENRRRKLFRGDVFAHQRQHRKPFRDKQLKTFSSYRDVSEGTIRTGCRYPITGASVNLIWPLLIFSFGP